MCLLLFFFFFFFFKKISQRNHTKGIEGFTPTHFQSFSTMESSIFRLKADESKVCQKSEEDSEDEERRSWANLPDEMFLRILQYMEWKSVFHCGFICHNWRRIALEESIWYNLLLKEPLYFTRIELESIRSFRNEFVKRIRGLSWSERYKFEFPCASDAQRLIHSQRFKEWLTEPFPPISQHIPSNSLFSLCSRNAEIFSRIKILSHYENYLKVTTKVALFDSHGGFFASISFLEHKTPFKPGQRFDIPIGQKSKKEKTWRIVVNFATRMETYNMQFSISNDKEMVGDTRMLEVLRDFLFPEMQFELFTLVLFHSFTLDSLSIGEFVQFSHLSVAKPISASECYASFKEVPVHEFELAIRQFGGDFVKIANFLPNYSWDSLSSLVKGYNSDVIVTRMQIFSYWTEEQILAFQMGVDEKKVDSLHKNPIFDKRSLRILWDVFEFYQYSGSFLDDTFVTSKRQKVDHDESSQYFTYN
eukprot:TRINITY_DN11374_c0_g1_i1.p1 TRINITY_DN11374_c0_g1~~TRINITY_DN11374_c0_g1_i1.p1  ORF type:complete len:475 (-),score=123.87 TRINITY_DN11374_c0_g1_i1:142-1566(-)